MSDINIVILNSIRSDLEQIKMVSHNVANANTVGFKEIISNKLANENLSNRSNNILDKSISLTQGQLRETNNKLDISVNGQAFMVVTKNNIQHLISSQRFSINESNQLETDDGSILLGTTGPIEVSTRNIKINKNGEIYENNKFIDQIEVVSVNNMNDVKISSEGLLTLKPDVDDIKNEESLSSFKVVQSQLEMSNVDSSHQMIKLMELSKHIESTQKAFSTLDQILDTGINQIGNR